MSKGIKIFAGKAGEPLAAEICKLLSLNLGGAKVARFNDGEVNVQLTENVRGYDVFVVNPTNPPAENFLDLVFLTEAAHDSSADRITMIPTYLGYNRQDRKDRPRVPTSAAVMIDFLARSGADRVLLLDLHSPPTAAHFRPLVVDHLFGSTVGIPYLKAILKNPFVVASPDKGGAPRAEYYSKLLEQEDDFVLFSKSRGIDGNVRKESTRIVGDVVGKDVLFVDDMIDTGGTIIADAEAAKKAGAKDVYVFATHGLFSKDAVAKLDASEVKEVVVTNTIYHQRSRLRTRRVKITTLSIAPLLAKAIRCLHDGDSLSTLIL